MRNMTPHDSIGMLGIIFPLDFKFMDLFRLDLYADII